VTDESCLPNGLIQNEEVLETMSREYIKRLMLNLFEKLKQKSQGIDELKTLIDSIDDRGCALLHYVAALNYQELVEVIHDYGGNLSLKTNSHH
jgi:hypothetical protein